MKKAFYRVFVALMALFIVPFGVPAASAQTSVDGVGERVVFSPVVEESYNTVKINDQLGYGWCIDLRLRMPSSFPNRYQDAGKLEGVTPMFTKEIVDKAMASGSRNLTRAVSEELKKVVPLDGYRRDVAVYLVKELVNIAKGQGKTGYSARKVNMALQIILQSGTGNVMGNAADLAQSGRLEYFGVNFTLDEFEALTGYSVGTSVEWPRGFFVETRKSASPIPAAGRMSSLRLSRQKVTILLLFKVAPMVIRSEWCQLINLA